MEFDAKERYIQNFMDLNDAKNGDYAVNISELNIKNLEKYLHLLDPNIPVIVGTRDSISILKHCVGRNWDKFDPTLKKEFNLSHNFRDYVHFITHKNQPIKIDFNALKSSSFISSKILPFFHNITPLDCSEILPDKAFETMQKLALKFHFNPPKNETYFQNYEFRGYIRYLLPITLYANENDPIFSLKNSVIETPLQKENSFAFTLSRNGEIKGYKNICQELSNDSICKDLGVYIAQENLKKIDKKFYKKIKTYLSEFIAEIARVTKEADEKILKEKDILEFLKQHQNLSLEFKKICDEDLAYFKKYHPNLVRSWHFYKDFEALCENFKTS